MNKIRFFSVIFGLLGACAAALGIYLAIHNMNASPVLARQPEEAKHQVVSMLDALCRRDYDAVSAALYGTPDLGLSREAQDRVGQMVWDAFTGSVRYELVGEFYATDSGVAQNVVITGLEMGSVTENLKERSQKLLEQRVAEAEDPGEVYDENNDYREELVMEVLQTAAREALQSDAREISWEITLNLVYENGQWWIMPEQTLLEAISGGILK